MSFCRITGRSRGLPKPNYFPLLAPISPADAKRCCRITGKSYGLPSHHYIPVLLTARSSKAKCKITNVSGELGPHHYSPEINYGNRKHEMMPDYRYIFPVLDGSTDAQKCLIELLLGKQVTEEKRYVYTVQERRCSLVFSAQMEAAVRDGDVRDVMLAKDSDTVLIKTKQGRSVSMDFKDFTDDVEMFEGEGPNAEVLKQREIEEMEEQKKKRKRASGLSSMKKIFESKEKLAEVQELEEESLRQVRKAKKAKLDGREKHDIKTFSYNNFETHHMQSKTSIVMSQGEWRDQLHPLIESWSWEDFEKGLNDEQVVSKLTTLPTPVKLTPYNCETELYEINHNISEVSTTLESVPCVNPLKPMKMRPSEDVLNAVKEIPKERLLETSDVTEKLINSDKLDVLPTMKTLPDVVKNIKKGKREKIAKITGLTVDINKAKTFIPGQVVNTPQGPVFIPGQTVETPIGPVFVPGLSVNTPAGPSLIPGHIVTNEKNNEPFFLAGQVLQTSNGEEFVCGQTIKTKDDVYRFVEGQTVLSEDGFKFVPGKTVNTGIEEVFVPGQTILTPDGVKFVPGQTITEEAGLTFTPGQNAIIDDEWQFIPGQAVKQDNDLQFVPGATIATPNGLKFVSGQTVTINGESCFVPGITKSTENGLEFVPGTTVETVDGPKFIEGQIVNTDCGEKFVPGKTIVQGDGHVEFAVAKTIEDISFSDSAPMGLPIDIKTCSVSEESLYVFGHMIQTASGIEFYPGSRIPKQGGKIVPGRLVKNEANESRFVPGTMVEGIFVPGQIVYTENGEQFVPGQVVDTADGPKFVPGQVVNTKSGPKFVPGQTIHTIDGPRFVPGQIIETKAGPTFIPGQVIFTEDEGSRFVPGQVVDTEEGPRFVPGRVVESDDHGVTFVPGQIVQTPEGLKFVAPDLTEGEEGLEFSVQSFVVTPEELKLLKIKTNPNDTSSTKGELTIDRNMLRQLSEAGMSIGRQVPADLPAISVLLNETRNAEALKAFVIDFGLKDEVANQLMDVIAHIIEMSAHLKSEISDSRKSDDSSLDSKKSRNSKKRMEMQEQNGTEHNGQSAQQEHVKNSIAAAVLAALVTAEQFEEVNNNISKEKYQLILKSIDTILGKSIDEDLVSAMFDILQKEEDKEILCEEILENSSEPKVELIKIAVNRALNKHSITEEDIVQRFGDFLSIENEVLGPAFKNISKKDTSLLHHVLGRISDSISFIKTDREATETLQKAIVSAVQDASTKELEEIINEGNKENLKELIMQSVGLAKVLGLSDVATNLLSVINDEDCMTKISADVTSLNILKRLTVMRKLADKTPVMHSALRKLGTDPILARTDPNLRDLVRESAALMIVPEEDLMTSQDVPISLLQPENSLAMEEFLYQRKKHRGAILIMKRGLQAVIPREASRAVLTGQIAYTVLDESGIRHFEPLHVFSALKLSQPTVNRFSMYTCLGGGDKENKNDDLETFTGYSNISNNQRITRLGGWSNRRYSGVLLDRENTRSRISNYENTPSYKGYSSRSLSRSRSSCSSGRSSSKVEDVVVATADYSAAAEDEVSLKAGDIVEVLDTKSALGSKCPTDPTLDVTTQLLDTSAAKHKLAVRPKKKHPKGKKKEGQRWLVRVIDDVQGGELRTRQGYVPAGILEEKQSLERDQTSLAARRQAVVRELIETEEEFGRDMQQVVSRYMKPMDKATTPKPVFDSRELLFSNFKQICEFHNTVLLEGIKYYASEPRMLGRALLRMEREFDKHVAYCRDEPRAHHLLTAEPTIAHYFQNLANKLGDDKGLTEHLKLPIQRINDYQLLLKELVKYSQRLGEDCADLQKALELFLGVPSRATDNKFLASIEGYRGNIYKLGRLLTHDWFTVTDPEGKAKERYLFLFKARILISKVKRIADDRSVFDLKDIIKLPEAEVKDIGEELKFELHVKNPSRILTLTAHKEQVKTNWLAEIRKYASDVLALAEHAADDLQVLQPPEELLTEPEEKTEEKNDKLEENFKKREREETEAEERQEKKSRVEDQEVTRVLTREESLLQTQAKRKASLEAQVAKKVAKTEVVEVSSTHETQKSSTVIIETSEVTADLESKSETVESFKAETSQSKTGAVETSKASAKVESQISVQSLEQKQTVKSSEQKLEATQSSTVQESSQSATSSTTAKQTVVTEQKSNHISEQRPNKPVENCIDSKQESRLGFGAEVSEQSVNNFQTAAEENEEMSSRYSRSSRLSGEYTSSSRKLSGGGRYESSSTHDSTGLSSYSSRRESGSRFESGSRIESGKYETGGALEGTASSRYESKYSTSSRIEGGSKYGIESNYESKTEGSKYGIDYDTGSKRDSIASKYGIDSKESKIESSSKLDSIASKYGIESKEAKVEYDASSKIDSIASKYGIERRESKLESETEAESKIDSIAKKYGKQDSIEAKIEGRSSISSSKYTIETTLEGRSIEGSASKIESKYESSTDGGASYETKKSKTAISNGSHSSEYESSKSSSKSKSRIGKPIFTTTLEGQNIEPGENAMFECTLLQSDDVKVTWLKDNKPLTDRLMDRCSISEDNTFYKLRLQHCHEDDTGVYTALAENLHGNAHCTAQLVVQEMTPEERKERNALNAPYFLVALKDTEILENTYLRFMIRVKGSPNPDVTFYRDDKEIISTSESDRVSIIRTRAEKGCYELVIPDVTPSDAGKYSCKAVNIYGEVTSEANVSVVDAKNIWFELPPGGEGLLAKGEKPQFTWKRDGQPFDPEERFKVLFGDDEDSLALVFQHVKPEDAGLYTCVAKTSTGNISCSAELTVQGAVNELHREPEKPKLVIEHREAIVSAGASAMLELQCKGYPKPNIVFKHEGKVVEADTRHKFLYEDEESMSLVIKNVTNADAGEYHVIASNELGEDTTVMNLVVKQPPKIKKVDNQSCMAGSTHTVTIEVEGTPAPDVSFYKDGVVIKSSERIQIVKETEYIYKIVIKDAKLTDTGSYSVIAKNEMSQCSDFWQWHVTSPPRVTKNIGETKVCEQKESVSFTVEAESEPAATVKWYKNKEEITESSAIKIKTSGSAHSLVISSAAKSDAGEYSCEIRNIHGSTSDSCLLHVRCAPHFTQPLRDTTASEGSVNVEFTVDVEAYPQPTIRWYQGDVEITEKKSVFTRMDSGSSHKLILKEVTAELAGTYSCKVTNDLGADSCQATFTVNRKPRITKSLVDMTVDAGQTLKLEVEVEGCPEPRVTWYKDGKEVQTDARIKIQRDSKRLENYHLTVTLIKEEDGGEYEVRAENEYGSVSSKSTVTVHTKEVHSRISKQEIVDNEIEEGRKRTTLDDNEQKIEQQTAKILKTEIIEEKSFWGDDEDDGKAKKISTKDVLEKKSYKAQKSVTVAEEVEEKSFWDDEDDGKAKKPKTEDVEQKKSYKAQKSVMEVAEEKSFWGDQDDDKVKKPEDVEQKKSYKAQRSMTEVAEEKSYWDDQDGGEAKRPQDVEQKKSYKAQRSVAEVAEEMSVWEDQDDGKAKKPEDFDQKKSYKAQKSVAEVAVEKSFWEDQDDAKAKKPEDVDQKKSYKAQRSVAEVAEEKSFWDDQDDSKAKIPSTEDVDQKKSYKAQKSVTEAEVAEEKSFWDDQDGGKAKKVNTEDIDQKKSLKAQKSVTKPEIAEEKSFWDSEDSSQTKKPLVEEVDTPKVGKGRKSISEIAEDKSFWDEDNNSKQPVIEEVDTPKVRKGRTSVSEVAEEKSFWGDDKESKKTVIEEVDSPRVRKGRTSISEVAEEKSFWDDDVSSKKPIVEEADSPEIGKCISISKVVEEESFWDDDKDSKKPIIEDVESRKVKSQTSFTTPETIEEKSPWDDDDDNNGSRKTIIEDVTKQASLKSQKSVTATEVAEDKSIRDDGNNERNKKPVVEDVVAEKKTGQKGVTKPESSEEVSLDEGLKSSKRKSIKKESLEEPMSAGIEDRVFETVTTFKTGDDGSIIMSKVSSTMSHGAIITGPAETHTLHKMTSTSVTYEEDDYFDTDKRVIKPNKPHKTSLEVEEIASHSYFLSELGHYTIPDHLRRGTYGIIEEPQTDSDAESIYTRNAANRAISIMSVSEDEMSWQNDSLSREISIEDLSKSIFDIDETRKVFSKDSYVRQSSFKEDFYTDEGEEESLILRQKSEKVFENDITEKLIHISKEFDEDEYKKVETKVDDIKNRILEELVIGPIKPFGNITKDVSETSVERKKSQSKLFIVEEEVDDEVEALLRRSQRQRSLLDDILTHEDEKAPPKLGESTLKDGHAYESLPLVYTVEASGNPKPIVRWLHDGKEVKPCNRVHITNDGNLYKIEIDRVDLKDKGEWQCEISNDLGKEVLKAQLSVSPESELRKPKFTTPLESQRVLNREPVCLKAVCSADPQPHVAWLLNGNEVTPDATVVTDAEVKDIEHGLKECTFTLNIPTGRHADTGEYTIKATNKYGIGESSARLDILLRPEIEGLKDVTAVPYEETTFVANVRANPIAEVKWSKDGYVIQPSSRHEIIEDVPNETYKLVVKHVGVEDGGVYTIAAKNEVGETTMQAKLIIHTGEPIFIKPLQPEKVRDYDDVTLKVRCDGVPKPQVTWYREGEEIKNDKRHTVTTEVGGQVDSELEIKHFTSSDAGKYKVRAANLCGEAFCEAKITLGQSSPGFVHKLDRSREVDEGEPLELKAKLDGSPIPTAKWYKDGVEISPSDSHIKQSSLPDGTIKLNIDHVTPEDCGAYKLIISNPHGDNSALCAVAVNPTPRKPSFSQELEDTKAVVGQPLKLEARVMAFPAPEIKWFKDGQPLRPSQAVSFINQPGGVIGLAIDNCKPEDAGVYSLTVTNKLGEVGSKANAEVQQKDRKPAFIAELQPAKVIEGFPIRLKVKVLGHPQPAVKWTHNGKEIVPDGTRVKVVSSPDGSHSLLVTSAVPSDAGTYAAVASNPGGDSASEAPLTIASRTDDSSPQERPQLINGLRDVIADEGQPLSVSAAFVGNPVPDVTWTKDGAPLLPSERILLTCDGKRVGLEINPVETPDAGVYGVKLVNPLGEDSSEGKLAVKKVYKPPSFSQKFTDLQQLPKFDAKFPARVSGIPRPDITWYKDGIPLSPSDKYNMKRDGDAVCLYVRDLKPEDQGRYKCEARNREGMVACEANLEVVDKIGKSQRMEPPSFLKKIGDTEVLRGMSAKFTACATGTPDPEVEWFRNDEKLFPCERIRIDTESTGLLRLTISGIDASDVGVYKCRIYNPHGEDSCTAQLTYDTLEPHTGKRPISDQYSDFDKMKKTGIPMPLADKPIISRMTDRHLTLSWKPSLPHGPRFPVTYQVEMCEAGGEWFTARTGLRSCVCDLRNLRPFVDYKLRVRVENKYGVSDPSPHATTHRAKLEPDPPKFVPYLQPGIDFRPETSPYFPKDFDIERPPHDGYAQAPRFLRQEHDTQYAVKGHNANLFWFVYGYPKPKMTYFFNDEPIEIGGRYDWSYTRNGQATLFINKMLERDEGWYEAVATNEHGQARQRVRLQCAEYPRFITRPHETIVLQRHTARLEARVAGVPFPEIKWYKDWQPLAASSRIKMQFIEPDLCVLVIHDTILKDEGLYSISLRNVAGSVSSSAMLHIEESQHEYSDRIREHPPRVKPSTKPFGDFFDLGDELGRGVQGVVYHAAERLTGRNYAAKIMHGNSSLKPFMKNELEIMNMLNDRHLVRLHSAFEHQHTLALVEELAAGGELVRDRLLRDQSYTEREIAGYIRQLLRGVKYMHDNSVAHLGLTIGELLLSHVGSDELKICDFGLSRRIIAGKHGALDYGMPEYVAPEVASGDGVSFPADMWSIGIITYILLSGHSPFRGAHDMETLTRVQGGEWRWHDEEWWSRLSLECRDFISKLLVTNWTSRMDVDTALAHPWLTAADRIYQEEFHISTDRLRNYYNLYRDWTGNAQCRTWFRRRPLSGAFTHPSKMVYPPGEIYTPEGTPERDPHDREPKPWDLNFKQWDHPDWEVSAKSESHYQNGPDTYLLQLRDTNFPVRLREYMKVACHRSPAYNLSVHDAYDPRTPIIRERRRFTDIMDEEIDDERRERINNYGQESFAIRRLRHELGTRLDSYAEAQAFMESKREGTLPFFREKPQTLPIKEGEPTKLSCLAVGDPKPAIQWFRNDMVLAEGQRVKIEEDEEGRSTLRFEPAMRHDVGFYKVVARNKVGQTVARTRVVEATAPDAPDSPAASEVSDTEVMLRWKQPKWDGNSPVLCYGLQYKAGDSVEWNTVGENIDHEFFVIRDLQPDTSYQFRLLSRNRIGWSDKGIPTDLVKTKVAGGPKLEVTKAMRHLQQLTESGREVTLEEDRPKLNYTVEETPIEWSTGELVDRYGFISEISRGRFSTVVKGCDRVTDNVVVAKLLELRSDTEVQVEREFECLRRLRHERIAGLVAAHRLPTKGLAALILERLQGADVLTYLAARHSYSEQTVATIVTQVLDALQYVHWRGYCHLDLQPDNVVMASVRDVHVKLVDFGSAHRVSKLGTSVPQVGHLEYRAPEIITDEPAYPQTDIWSVGVLTYVMLSGVSPYRGADDAETKQNIAYVRYRFDNLYKEITQEATRFLMFLFKKVPLKRPTAEECHEHRWLTQSDFMNKKRERAIFLGNRLKEFSDEYHDNKTHEATQAEAAATAFGGSIASPRILARSNSIQEELLTTFASQEAPTPPARR